MRSVLIAGLPIDTLLSTLRWLQMVYACLLLRGKLRCRADGWLQLWPRQDRRVQGL
jgi:hypothetical protein